MRLENSRNNLFGMEVSPGIELLKLDKKNVIKQIIQIIFFLFFTIEFQLKLAYEKLI